MFVKIVQDYLCHLAPFKIKDHPYAFPVRFIPYLGYSLYFFPSYKLGNLFYQPCLIYLIRNLRDYDIFSASVFLLNLRLCPDLNNAPACGVCINDSLHSMNQTACRKIRPLYSIHQVLDSHFGIIKEHNKPVYYLAEIMRRYIGCHPDGNA